MTSNYENVYKVILPRLRERAARMMAEDKKMMQGKIPALLGVTQAAVSKYLKDDGDDDKGRGVVIKSEKLEEMVESILNGHDKDAQRCMCSICQDNVKFGCRLIVK